MVVLSTENLSKSYGSVDVLQGISMSVDESGQIVGLLGPNGIGKTTFLEIVTGQRGFDSGSAEVLGFMLPEESQSLKHQIGILPEKESPSDFLTAREYLTFFGKDRGMSDEEVSESISYWSETLQFTDVLDVLSSDLSRGQQQKVMITQAFMHSPELVFIDEPLANLDPIIQSIFIDELNRYTSDGNTVLVSTHQVEFALEVCSTLHLFPQNKNHTIVEDVSQLTDSEVIELLNEGDTNE